MQFLIGGSLGSTNKHRYTMAVQSAKLRQHLRNIPGIPVIHFNERGVMVMEMPSDATIKQKESVSLYSCSSRNRTEVGAPQLENAKLTEQLAKPMPTLDNVIIGENTVPQPAPQPVRSRKVSKAPNPLSQRKKKDIQTGRPSKKQLLAEQEREAEKGRPRAEKRPRELDESEDGIEELNTEPSRQSEVGKAEDGAPNNHSRPVEGISSAASATDDAEQKKKRRKRRKKASGVADTHTVSDVGED